MKLRVHLIKVLAGRLPFPYKLVAKLSNLIIIYFYKLLFKIKLALVKNIIINLKHYK